MRVILLAVIALLAAGCGAEVTDTTMAPVSMCTTYLQRHTVRVTIDGLQATKLCEEYAHNRAPTGERWTDRRPAGVPATLPTACRLQSGSGETEVIVADVRSGPEGPAVCGQWRASGWSPLVR